MHKFFVFAASCSVLDVICCKVMIFIIVVLVLCGYVGSLECIVGGVHIRTGVRE
ncbi:hypothetical protein HanHA300_Chr17g0636241 [Helianthus annuus]|nr:hypothetical protein HanHA300_Chr17g0636241 [Helianthus annuus]KAJ0842271.1 hypothetical protein HanPSC8_Chr14g0639761 [Helianthus annuus]